MSVTAKRIAKNSGYLYLKIGITMFVTLYTTRLILSSLGASDFGIFNLVGGAISMLGFLNASLGGATQRYISYANGEGRPDKCTQYFNVAFVLHIIMALIVGVVLIIFGVLFFNKIINVPDNRINASIIVYGSLILSTMFTVASSPYDAVLNAHENMRYYAFVGILESLLKLGTAFVVCYSAGDKLMIYGILMGVIPFLTLSIMRIYCHKNYDECNLNFKKYWDISVVKEMSSYTGWSLVDAMTGIVGSSSLNIVLNSFFGTLLNAAQGVASQVGGQMSVFSRNMIKAITPVIIKSEGAGSRDRMLYFSVIGCKYCYLLLAIFAIPFIFESNYILTIWLKNVPEWTQLFCQLMLVRTLLEQLTVNLWNSIAATGDIKNFYLSKGIVNILPLLLSWVGFALGFPPYWLYIVWIFCWGILNGIIIIYFAKKKCKLNISELFTSAIKPCAIITIASCLFSGAIVGSIPESFLRLITTIMVSTVVFIVSYLLTNSPDENRAIKKCIKSLKRPI